MDEIALARIGFNKSLMQAIEKIKASPKIAADGWKRIFIVFKSRHEKRRNWKEKNRLLKELDEKFTQKTENEAQEGDEPSEVVVDLENDDGEKPEPQETKKTAKPKPEVKVKTVTKRKTEESDEESEKDSEPEVNFESDEEEDGDSNDGSESDYEDDEEDDEDSEMTDDSIVADFTIPEIDPNRIKSSILPAVAAAPADLKPLVIANKPAHMEIRQLNLDELKDLAELPIENKSADSNGPEDTNVELAAKKKLKNDAFFLDSNGNEIVSSSRFDPGLNQPLEDQESYRYGARREAHSNYVRAKRDFSGAKSSFRSSLGGAPNRNERFNYNNNNNNDNHYSFRTNRPSSGLIF